MTTAKKPAKNTRGPTKKTKELSRFTGRKQNHLRTGAKYYVVAFRRDRGQRKSYISQDLSQFATLGDAKEYAAYYSRKREDAAYVVVGISDYEKSIKGVFTYGKVNESLTSEFQRIYGKKFRPAEMKDRDSFLRMPV